MRRRDFIASLGSAAAAWPLGVRAQQTATIGYLDFGSLEMNREAVAAVQRGLAETGYVEGRNLAIEYRWAEGGNYLALLPDLISRRVSAIVAPSVPAASAAKAATQTMPIVFSSAVDPVEAGLVASINRPGGNLTGMSGLISAVAGKRLQLLHEVIPAATTFGFLVTSVPGGLAGFETNELQAAARTLGLRLMILNADTPREFEPALAKLVGAGAGGLVVSGGKSFTGHADQLVALMARYRMPAIFGRRDGAAAGGLMSFGIDFPEMYRQVGVYTGRILKGERPGDLPVQQATKVELIINLKSAKALGITVPITLIGRADEVIE